MGKFYVKVKEREKLEVGAEVEVEAQVAGLVTALVSQIEGTEIAVPFPQNNIS